MDFRKRRQAFRSPLSLAPAAGALAEVHGGNALAEGEFEGADEGEGSAAVGEAGGDGGEAGGAAFDDLVRLVDDGEAVQHQDAGAMSAMSAMGASGAMDPLSVAGETGAKRRGASLAAIRSAMRRVDRHMGHFLKTAAAMEPCAVAFGSGGTGGPSGPGEPSGLSVVSGTLAARQYSAIRKDLRIQLVGYGPRLSRQGQAICVQESQAGVPIYARLDEVPLIPSALCTWMVRRGCTDLTPIQRQAFPVICSGRSMIGIAPTGSGKTFAYAVPLVVSCLALASERRRRGGPRAATALVLVPTRELAVQTCDVLSQMLEQCEPRLRVSAVFGGSEIRAAPGEVGAAETGAPQPAVSAGVIVATPGRLIQLLSGSAARAGLLRACAYVVVDEADVLFDTGFRRQTETILGLCPPNCQRIFMSATFSGELRRYIVGIFSKLMRGLAPFSLEGGGRSGAFWERLRDARGAERPGPSRAGGATDRSEVVGPAAAAAAAVGTTGTTNTAAHNSDSPRQADRKGWEAIPSNKITVCTVGNMLFPSPHVAHALVDVTDLYKEKRDLLSLLQFSDEGKNPLFPFHGGAVDSSAALPSSPSKTSSNARALGVLPSFESLMALPLGGLAQDSTALWLKCVNDQLRPLLKGADALPRGSALPKSRARFLHRILLAYFASNPLGRAMVFLNSQDEVEALWKRLSGYEAKRPRQTGAQGSRKLSIARFYSGLEQETRLEELGKYRSGAATVLITSGGCGRGLDIPQTSLVINYDFPASPEDYVHQTGRTGRGYLTGFAVTFVNVHADSRSVAFIQEALPALEQRLVVKSDEALRRCAFYADSTPDPVRIPTPNTQRRGRLGPSWSRGRRPFRFT